MRSIQKIIALLLLFFCHHSFAQTGVKVTYYDETVQVFNVATSGKLYFETDNLLVQLSDAATPTTIPISIIRKITFTDTLSTLGVAITQFSAVSNNCAATVNWKSTVEENFSYYELQYGTNSAYLNNFISVLGRGNNQSYSVNLPNLNGKYFYRLKMVDLDGETKYSNIQSVQINCSIIETPIVTPNPCSDFIRIKLNNASTLNIRFYTSNGQLVKKGIYLPNQAIDITDLSAGLYFVQINGLSTIKIIKK
ncbi:MAG: hypothetical protein RLY16_677 [Bacteroidota bacterium]|jgi:hypothetical protein